MAGTNTVFKLRQLTKTYVIGTRKNALKAQKAIEKLQASNEHLLNHNDKKNAQEIKENSEILTAAQKLFSEEHYEESYRVVTGKSLKRRPQDKGSVVHALRGVNLEIKKGEMVAIVGPSGSGKSTLLNMLGLLDEPTAGEIYLAGKNVQSIKHRDLPDIRAKELGFVFQSFNLIPTLTAIENVMLPLKYAGVPAKVRRKVAHDALTKVGLASRANHSPNELSGGERQRVAIARSIVNNPSIVFGDELTGELDSKLTKEIMSLISKLNDAGQTFIIVTHNPEVAKACKRVIYMRDGRVEKDVVNSK